MRFCIVIPTYNESKAIPELIQGIRKQDLEVLVVDDGSTDDTARISQICGAAVLTNPKNQGKGYSLTRGSQYALDKNFDALIVMDGDGQHSPEDLPLFIESAQALEVSIIVGNRMQDTRSMPLVRIYTNKFMSWIISKITRQKIPDTQCGFRLIKRDLLEKLKFTVNRFEIESEILIQAARLGYKIKSLPIKTIYQKEKSRINPFIDTLRFIGFMIRQVWTSPK